MAQRLPTPGSDGGDWGDILNAYLEVSHASDGTLNSNVVGTSQIQNNAVTNTQLDVPTQTAIAAVASKYVKPPNGIPSTDLTAAAQTNLTSASTAVQPSTTLSGDLSGTIASPIVAKINGIIMPNGAPSTGQVIQATSTSATNWATISSTTVSDATSSTKGIIQLDGDLGGTAASPTVTTIGGHTPVTIVTTLTGGDLTGTLPAPTVAKVNGVAVTGTPTSGQVITASSSSAAAWTTPAAGAGNATSSTPGLVQLDGDLGGTATSPSVTSIKGITLPASAPASGNVLTATSASATAWTTPAAGVTLDSTAGDIQPLGSQSAGSSSLAAKADHVHPTTGLVTTTTSLSGDVTGTASSTTVAKVNGVAVTGTPSASQVLTATSGTAAAWTTPAAGAGNATSSSPGLVQLDGDLGGTATNPSVVSIKGITLPSSAPSASGQVLTATSTSATAWTTPAAGVMLDSTVSDIAPLGTQAAGSVGKAADAGHVHTMPRLDQVSNPTTNVSLNSNKITNLTNGSAATDAAAYGQIPVAGTTAGTYAAGNDSRINNAAQAMTPLASPITSAYTANVSDIVQVNAASGAVNVKLPNAPADKSRVIVKLISGTSITNVATIQTQGSDVFDVASGSTTATLILQNQAKTFQYQLSSGIWYALAADLPLSSLVTGSSHTVTSAYTLTSLDHVIMADATSAAFTITLPTAVGFNGRYTVEAITASTNVVTLATTSSQTIEGASTINLGTAAANAPYGAVDLVSDGANWRIV
jgi:hypothetical protein